MPQICYQHWLCFYLFNCTQFYPLFINLPDVKLSPEKHTPLPDDVLKLGRLNAVKDIGQWPRPSHQDVLTCINNLPPQCCNDYNRVSFPWFPKFPFFNTCPCIKLTTFNSNKTVYSPKLSKCPYNLGNLR